MLDYSGAGPWFLPFQVMMPSLSPMVNIEELTTNLHTLVFTPQKPQTTQTGAFEVEFADVTEYVMLKCMF